MEDTYAREFAKNRAAPAVLGQVSGPWICEAWAAEAGPQIRGFDRYAEIIGHNLI